MAHFAKISENNEVLQVLTLEDKYCMDENNNFSETVGQAYLEKHNNWPSNLWIQTSYNTSCNQHLKGGTPFRGNYAGIGYIWDLENNIFLPPKPFPSWVKHLESASWKSPIGDAPTITEEQSLQNQEQTHRWGYIWDEDNLSWNLVDLMI
jgi:hypothetical protein